MTDLSCNQDSFYILINHVLCNTDRRKVLYDGGVDLRDIYRMGRRIVWHQVSASTNNGERLKNDQDLGDSGVRNMFLKSSGHTNGKARQVSDYKSIQSEAEVILPQLDVSSQLDQGDPMTIPGGARAERWHHRSQ